MDINGHYYKYDSIECTDRKLLAQLRRNLKNARHELNSQYCNTLLTSHCTKNTSEKKENRINQLFAQR